MSASADHPPASLRPETVAVTAGRPAREVDAPFNTPVHFASTYVGRHDTSGPERGYGRDGNPSWEAFEETVGALEGGRALSFASGMAAAHAVLELLEPGSVVVLPRHCYLGVSAAIRERARRGGWTVRPVDVSDTAEVLAAAQGADLLWLESPTNPMIEVADLPAIAAGRPAGTLLAVDNTFATPLLQQPLRSGADVVVHAVTKMMAGHSDVLLGVAVVRPEADELWSRLVGVRHSHGAVPGPMESYLALRGLRTLPLRLERAQANAGVLAGRLAEHPAVLRVRYPGVAGDPGHTVATRTMHGFGSIVSIDLAGAAVAEQTIDRCRLWAHATSLGGVESSLERRRRWPGELLTVPEGLIRLSVGIEHVDDLWADLAQALPPG